MIGIYGITNTEKQCILIYQIRLFATYKLNIVKIMYIILFINWFKYIIILKKLEKRYLLYRLKLKLKK